MLLHSISSVRMVKMSMEKSFKNQTILVPFFFVYAENKNKYVLVIHLFEGTRQEKKKKKKGKQKIEKE